MYRSSVPYYSRSAGYSTAGTRRSADDYTRGTEPLSSSVYSSLNSSRYASQPISTTLSSALPSASSSASSVISSVASIPETSSAQAGGASSRAYLLRSGREYDYSEPKNESTGPAAAFSNVTPYSSSYTAQTSPATDNTTRPSNNTTTSTTTRTSTSYQSPRTSSYTLSGRPFEYTRSTEPSRASSYSSRTFPSSERYSSVGFRTVASSPGSVPRSEAERARYRMLGCDEVGGRRNVASDKDFMDKNKALKKSDQQKSVDQLIPKEINLHEKDNRRSHHTDKYEHSNLIVRRGQSFDVTVTFNRAYDARRDVITLQFAVGYRPQQSKGTVIRVPISLTKERVYKAWSANLAQVNKDSVRLQVTSPVDAVVGKYQLYVETKTTIRGSDKPEEYRYQHSEDIIVLFNPWCREDSVYLDQEALREEYVLNDSGRIWIGTVRKHCGMPWNFGQFEDVSLNSCLWLMDKAQLATAARANPLRVSRSISAMANFNDQDGGILHGRWDGNYPRDTTAPTSWSGSVAILEQFWQKKCDIKYGQCWVFSGLVTTLLRALGIPTRSVTNFASAHDSDASMTIDFHFDEDGKPLKELDDSVWNFHVWNESWFKRPDLPDGHDGWQAHDATPQETSYGVFRCGPASVKAVKQGEVYLPYDTSFVFAEVNGDRVFWEVEENGPMKPIRVDKKCIGKLISTKAVGSDDREDITHEYKHPEGSIAERRAVELAYKFSSRKDQAIYGLPAEDVKFTFDLPEDVPTGKDVSVALKMKNATYQSRTVKAKMTAVIGFYTGISCKDLKEEEFDMILEPRQEKAFILEIPSALYLDKCEADGGLKIYVKATVKENGQRFASYDIIEFQKPDMEIEVTRGKPRIGNDIEVKLSFENPLPLNIRGGKWYIETSGANPKCKIIPNSATVSEGREVQTSFKITPYRAGLCQVCATFRSDVISGVRGYGSLKISE